MNKKIITVGEMFSGPGGIGLALNKAEEKVLSLIYHLSSKVSIISFI